MQLLCNDTYIYIITEKLAFLHISNVSIKKN